VTDSKGDAVAFKMILFHEMNSPERNLYMVLDDYDGVESLGSGSAVKRKGSDTPTLVHETPEEVAKIIEEKSNE
jgi:hypothetical protein